jgi:hypothetical protein
MTTRHRTTRASRLVRSGIVEIAAGALSGWIYTLARTQPQLADHLGIREAERVRQWHLDLVMMGTAVTVCGLAVHNPPRIASAALRLGSWTNAMAFLPLAVKPNLYDNRVFLAASVGSFVATSVGFTGLAAAALRRR